MLTFAIAVVCVDLFDIHPPPHMQPAATFFCTYELTKSLIGPLVSPTYAPLVHMLAATAGEVVCSCEVVNIPCYSLLLPGMLHAASSISLSLQVSNVVRVPFEVVKQRAQANKNLKPSQILKAALQSEV